MRIAVDIGGTFTDLTAIDDAGTIFHGKQLTACDDFGKAHPGAWPARVQIHLKDGRFLKRLCPVAPGDPGAEPTPAERLEKFRRLATPRLGVERAERLADAVAGIETLPDTEPVLDAFDRQETVS